MGKKKESTMRQSNKQNIMRQGKISMFVTLLLFAIVPMLTLGLIVGTFAAIQAKRGLKNLTFNYMYSMANTEGTGIEDEVANLGADKFFTTVSLRDYCADIKLKDIPSSYAYVANADGTMLYHPTAEKIGQPVANEVIQKVCADMKSGKRDKPHVVAYNFKGEEKYAAYYVAQDKSFVLVISADERDVMRPVQNIVIIILVVGIICAILSSIFVVLTGRKVSKPIQTMAESMAKLSKGDLRVNFEAESDIHEIKAMVTACQNMKAALSESISTIKGNSDPLSGAVIDVDTKTSKNVSAINQISQTINEVADTSQDVAKNAQDMAEKAVVLGGNIDQLTENVKRLRDASAEIDEANKDATDNMNTVMQSSDESVQAAHDISEKVAATNSAVANISECVQMIEDISSQTNLLSLNASIEAARAGEAGRGFAVVAEEIRQLADDSAKSANEIRVIVESITGISRETVDAATRVADIITKEQEYIGETQSKFETLSNAVDISTAEIEHINEMAKELDSIKEEFTNATANLGAISEELGASAQEVSASCEQVAAACTDTQERTEEMRSINDNLAQAVEFFQI